MILAADIGGTKLLFGLFEEKEGRLNLLFQCQYVSKLYESVEDATLTFLSENNVVERVDEIQAACFSVAGPIVNGSCHLTNLDWFVEQKSLEKKFPKMKKILLCNDMEATAKGISLLEERDLVSLTPTPETRLEVSTDLPKPTTNRNEVAAILVPGTGLGEAFVYGDVVFPSEGGHCEFGPRNREEARLLEFLQQRNGHASYEQILSGKGLCSLAEFLIMERGFSKTGDYLTPEEITRGAKQGDCPLYTAVVETFSAILGAEAGNLALKTMATGGIYLGSNIVREILPWLKGDFFLGGFLDKGRFSTLMKTIPVYVILKENVALFGSARMVADASQTITDLLKEREQIHG